MKTNEKVCQHVIINRVLGSLVIVTLYHISKCSNDSNNIFFINKRNNIFRKSLYLVPEREWFFCFCLFDHYFHQLIKEQRYTTKKYRKRKKHGKGYQQKCLSSIQSLARGQFTTHCEKKLKKVKNDYLHDCWNSKRMWRKIQ